MKKQVQGVTSELQDFDFLIIWQCDGKFQKEEKLGIILHLYLELFNDGIREELQLHKARRSKNMDKPASKLACINCMGTKVDSETRWI